MDTAAPRQTPDAAFTGLQVLFLPKNNLTHYLVPLLQAAKARWDWRVDVLGQESDRPAFAALTAPSGRLFVPPDPLRSAEWEDDPGSAAATDRQIREAELLTGLPLGRVVLAGERSIGRAFLAPMRYVPSTPVVRRVLRDNSEPSRIVRRWFRFADDMLEASGPDLIVAGEWATPLQFTVWMAAARRDIPCVANRLSKINSDHCFWTSDRMMLNSAAAAAAAAKRNAEVPVSDAAKAHIRTFREQPVEVKYVRTKWHRAARKKTWLKSHAGFARTMARELVKATRGQGGAQPEPVTGRVLGYYRALIMARRHRRFFRRLDEAALAGMEYVYFPMHKEAEVAQAFQATQWHDQRNTVRVLAGLLPAGYRLLVREHRSNYGHRRTRYYRELSQLPNVILIDAFDWQFKYLRNADLIVTENGSSGWEGLLLGRRVLTLARTFYDGAGLGTNVEDPDRLNAAILDALASPAVADPAAHDRHLGHMIDAELETTFPMGPEGTGAALDRLTAAVAGRICPRRAAAASPAPA